MSKIVKLDMVFDSANSPDFGSISKTRDNDLVALATDIPKLNNTLTRAICEPLIVDGSFSLGSGVSCFIADWKRNNSVKEYMYDESSDSWYAVSRPEMKQISGVPPITYKSDGSALANYRIYGQTSRNLFDMKKFAETASPTSATINYSGNSLIFTPTENDAYVNEVYFPSVVPSVLMPNCIDVQPLTTYTITMNSPYKCYISWLNDSGVPVHRVAAIPNDQSSYTFTTPENCTKLLFRLGKYVTKIGDTFTISDIMLNEGSTPLPYEPYGESVGDLVTSGEHAGEYKVSVTVTNGTDTLTTPIYLPEQIKKVGDEAEYIDYSEQKQHRVRKNLLPNDAISRTLNGITVTVNEDGSITCDGTATTTTEIRINRGFLLSAGNYRLTGCPSGGSGTSYYLRAWYGSESIVWLNDNGEGFNFTLTDTTTMLSSIVIENAQVVEHLTFYPMIRKADIEDDTYEPYIENTELDVTLPALPTVTGTNVLSVGTEVQPSNVVLYGRINNV